MNFAKIYNPKTKKTISYQNTHSSVFDMKVEGFLGENSYFFEVSDTIFYDKIALKESTEISSIESEYCELVEKMILEIKKGNYSKLVAAQKQVHDTDNSKLNFESIFSKLIDNFPNTFVYVFYINQEIWIGASPEIVGILEGNKFSTISLAGTRNNEVFTQKEIDEQQIVSDTISQQINIKTDSSATRILSFGNLTHLVNEYQTEVKSDFDFEEKIHEIHPSPALIGLPKKESIAYVLRHESIERELYCGLCHQIDTNESQYSFALIRCGKITKNQMMFYAGAGVTADSSPIDEWRETNEKIDTLFNVIKC